MKEKLIRHLANRAARRLLLAAVMFDLEYITATLEMKKTCYKIELRKLNEEVLARGICPKCKSEYTTFTSDGYFICSSCDHQWTN